jgi:hypothetical protein
VTQLQVLQGNLEEKEGGKEEAVVVVVVLVEIRMVLVVV